MKNMLLPMSVLSALTLFCAAPFAQEDTTTASETQTYGAQLIDPLDGASENVLEAPLQLFQNFQQAFLTSAFELSYLQVSQGRIEPIRLIHGVVDGVAISHRVHLNGPANEVVHRQQQVAYFEPGKPPYSLSSSRLPGLFGNLANIELAQLQANYQLVIAGKSRVAGRPAKVLRMIPNSDALFGLYVWLDYSSSLPLRVDLVGREGDLVEQYMAVHLAEYFEPTDWIKELASIQLPPAMSRHALNNENDALQWQLAWKPQGMSAQLRQQHHLALLSERVDYMQLSDGLFTISVYVNPHGKRSPVREQQLSQGATHLHTLIKQGIEITVVGDVPLETAVRIANNVMINTQATQP